jgi:hypothetical protein
VALQRIKNVEHDPNLLVTRVSAVEAVSRSLLVHQGAKTSDDVLRRYEELRRTGPNTLITLYIRAVAQQTPEAVYLNEMRLLRM